MAQTKVEKLGKFIEKAENDRSKEHRLDIKIVRASDLDDISFLPTGITLFDAAFGGLPRGMYSMIFGGEGVGKTTLLVNAMANTIATGGSAVLLEPENRQSKTWMTKFLDLGKLYTSQATSLGKALDASIKLVESNLVDLLVVDSLAALAVKELKGKGTEGDHMALVARRMPTFFQTATESVATSKTAFVFVHQKRCSMDAYTGGLETFNGGNHLRHQLSLILNVRRASAGRDPDKGERFKSPIGNKLGFMMNLKVIKNSTGTSQEDKSIQLDFRFGEGIDNVQSIGMFAIRNKIIFKDKGPGSYKFNDNDGEYSQKGMLNVIADLRENEGLLTRVTAACTKYLRDETVPATAEVDADIEFEQKMLSSDSNPKGEDNVSKE